MTASDEPRLYFLPPDFDFDAMPDGFRAAYDALIVPAFRELVLEAPDALVRSAGSSLVQLALVELLDQFDLGALIGNRIDAEERHRMLTKHFRTIRNKERWIRLYDLLRATETRRASLPLSPFEQGATHDNAAQSNP